MPVKLRHQVLLTGVFKTRCAGRCTKSGLRTASTAIIYQTDKHSPKKRAWMGYGRLSGLGFKAREQHVFLQMDVRDKIIAQLAQSGIKCCPRPTSSLR